jgi:peptidoglycan-associated lipoprotein
MKIDILLSAAIIFFFVLVTGCATKGPTVEQGPPEGQQPGVGVDAEGAVSTTPLGQDKSLQLDALNDPESPLAVRIIYFNFDSSEVAQESLDVISSHGQYLVNHPQQRVRLEGHTDERGSREYNLALGEQRAQSVNQLMKLQGVAPNQIELISYGEELPASFGHDEESWRLNRRVELVYIDQNR